MTELEKLIAEEGSLPLWKRRAIEYWKQIEIDAATIASLRQQIGTPPPPLTLVGGLSDEDRNYLEEVADGAWGDDPRMRGLARDRLKALNSAASQPIAGVVAEAPRLTSGERLLLDWLSKEESSALGECEGGDLAHLEQMGLAVIVPALGKHRHYSRVSLTDAGRAAIAAAEGPKE